MDGDESCYFYLLSVYNYVDDILITHTYIYIYIFFFFK